MKDRKGWHHFSRWSGNFHPVKWVNLDDFFRHQPGEENPDAPQVAINGVAGESLILDMVERVIRETLLLLQVEDEGSELMLANPGGVGARAV